LLQKKLLRVILFKLLHIVVVLQENKNTFKTEFLLIMIHSIGVDIIEITRIKRAAQRWGDHFLKKILTPSEYDYCVNPSLLIHSVAARFAAKEAFYKSLPESFQKKGVGWQDVQVYNDEIGKPHFSFSDSLNILEKNYRIHLSVSHSSFSAVAVVIFETWGAAT